MQQILSTLKSMAIDFIIVGDKTKMAKFEHTNSLAGLWKILGLGSKSLKGHTSKPDNHSGYI